MLEQVTALATGPVVRAVGDQNVLSFLNTKLYGVTSICVDREKNLQDITLFQNNGVYWCVQLFYQTPAIAALNKHSVATLWGVKARGEVITVDAEIIHSVYTNSNRTCQAVCENGVDGTCHSSLIAEYRVCVCQPSGWYAGCHRSHKTHRRGSQRGCWVPSEQPLLLQKLRPERL